MRRGHAETEGIAERKQALESTRRYRAGRETSELSTWEPESLVWPRAPGRESSRLGFSPSGGSLGRVRAVLRTLTSLLGHVRALIYRVLAFAAIEAKVLAATAFFLFRADGAVLNSIDLHRDVLVRGRGGRGRSGRSREGRWQCEVRRSMVHAKNEEAIEWAGVEQSGAVARRREKGSRGSG